MAGITGITSLALYGQYIGSSLAGSTSIDNMDYSRAFVIISVAASFLAAFFTVCDRTAANYEK